MIRSIRVCDNQSWLLNVDQKYSQQTVAHGHSCHTHYLQGGLCMLTEYTYIIGPLFQCGMYQQAEAEAYLETSGHQNVFIPARSLQHNFKISQNLYWVYTYIMFNLLATIIMCAVVQTKDSKSSNSVTRSSDFFQICFGGWQPI